MKTIFDELTRNELIGRINLLDADSTARWGKMNIYQMLKHCSLFDEWVLGIHNPTYKQVFIGRLFGKIALKDFIGNDKPVKRNVGTLSFLKVTQADGDVALEKL